MSSLCILQVDARNIDGATPLCHACCSGSVECVKLLLRYGANVNPALNLLTSPLHEAVVRGKDLPFLVTTLIKNNILPNLLNAITLSLDRLPVIHILIEAGANIEMNDLHYGTPLHVAAFKDNSDAAMLLLKAGRMAINA